ncbi:MAG: protein-L-isoaspartate(D-aspartate) O-methyltransferase [Candidatus Margulisbacteria bacterium]|nr:protein-L-isoaspartate(D-aspartate) O-methyltransferase [Candidatus Margulisiibacteriota bacterium]
MVEAQLIPRGITNQRVLEAMRTVPREKFVPKDLQELSYNDGTLPIGEGQTISQPYMIAKMAELMELKGGEKVLEIGAGSGYQAAVLAECAGEVYTIDRLEPLAELAKNNLKAAGYNQVKVIFGDGTLGYPEHAPYYGIIVACGAPKIPDALLAQLAEGGRLVIPVGDRMLQRVVIVKKEKGKFQESYSDGCVFVPLIGEDGW